MSTSCRRKKRARSSKQKAAPFDLQAEITRLMKERDLDLETARGIAEDRAERYRLGMTPEQYREYFYQRLAEQGRQNTEREARDKAEREAAQRAEDEAEAPEREVGLRAEDARREAQRTEIDALEAQAEQIEWPDPATLPGPEKNEEAAERPKKTETEHAPRSARGYVELPYLVIDRVLPAMPDNVFKIYCALLRFEGYKSGQMWPGQDRLADMTGLGKVTVWRAMKVLREAGLLTRRRRFGTSNV